MFLSSFREESDGITFQDDNDNDEEEENDESEDDDDDSDSCDSIVSLIKINFIL